MSEDSTTPEETAPEAATPDEPFDASRAKEKIAKANREAQQLRERLKALEPLAQKAQEMEDAQKSESERVAEKLTAAEQRAQAAEARLMLAEVAQEKGLTPAQAKRLVGTTREELLADADDYLASLPVSPEPPTSRTPVAALRPGALPNAAPPTLDQQIAELMKDPRKNRTALISLENQKLAQIVATRKAR